MNERDAFIIHVEVPKDMAKKISSIHRVQIEMLVIHALRLMEPDIEKFYPCVWMEEK